MDKEEIIKVYKASLIIPVTKPLKQFILCPVGLVGAGKTTVVKPLSEKLDLVRISSDDIREIMKKYGMGYELLPEIAREVAKSYLEQGYSLCIDADCSGKAAQPLLKEAEDKYHPIFVWIHINSPEEFILNKLRKYKHTWLFKDADEAIANYYAKKPSHEHLDYPFVYTFDTSRADLQNQIEEAHLKIRELVK